MAARTFALLGSSLVALTAPLAHAEAQECGSGYAESLAFLTPKARAIESRAQRYAFAVRTSATYECVSYGADATLKRTRQTVSAVGTAFGYRRDGGDTLLLTNQHVAEWPEVTTAEHPIDAVPAGCKRVADALAIVDNDNDAYAPDDTPLTRVVVDPQFDVAVLRAHVALPVMPWKVGKSADLSSRDIVEVKGYPLGAFQATNVGKVISTHDHDEYGEWNHDDFVTDALLSHGGSGSPVLAVSCKTGEFELVGIFHANYSRGSALNVVVAIDQLHELITTLKRPPAPAVAALDATARAKITEIAAGHGDPPFFSFGGLTAVVHARGDGSLVFTVYGAGFPAASRPLLVVEDLPATDKAMFGRRGAVYAGGTRGLQAIAADGDDGVLVDRTLAALRQSALAMFEDRRAAVTASASREAFEQERRQARTLARLIDAQRGNVQLVSELVGRVPEATSVVTLAQIEADPQAPALAGTP